MNDQIELPFGERSEEPPRPMNATQELHQSGRVLPVRLSEDDFDIDPDRLEGDLA